MENSLENGGVQSTDDRSKGDPFFSEPISNNELVAVIPENEDDAFKAVRNNNHTTIVRRVHEGFDINTVHVEQGDKVFTVCDWTRMKRQIRLKKYTILHVAALHGTIETIELLLSQGANVNLLDENRWSPISVAASAQRPDVIKLLIKNGANVNVQSVSGRTPLIEGITNNNLDTVKLLIDAGADRDLADMKGLTPLFSCLTMKESNLDIIRTLIKEGCNVNYTNKQGATPLMMAAGMGRHDAVQILLDAGADINVMDKQGKSAFHMAVGVKMALLLIHNGATSDYPDSKGQYPIDSAAKVGHIGMMRLLLGSDCHRSAKILEVPRVVQARESLPIFNKWLHQELFNPRELKRLCRQTVRESLSPLNTTHIKDLPVPSLLKNYLLLKHLDLSFDSVADAKTGGFGQPVNSQT